MDDVALVAAVQRGDEAALADLFEECHGWAYSTCLNALRDPSAAQEATGRVMEAVVRTRLLGAESLRAAMIRLIYDACSEVERELGRKRWLRRKGEQPPAAPDPHDLRLVAWRAAGDLSGPDRILFALAAGAGQTSESLAAAVAPSRPGAIAARLDAIRDHVVSDIVAARSLDDCPDLRDTLRYAAREPDQAARRRIRDHLAGNGRRVPPCPKCTTTRDRWPLAALAALLPLTAVPAGENEVLLDRMEAALKAGLAAGSERTPAVGPGADPRVPVIDGDITEELPRIDVEDAPPPRRRPAAERPMEEPAPSNGAAPPPDNSAPPRRSAPPGGVPGDPRYAGAPRRRRGVVAAAATAAGLLVLGTIGLAVLTSGAPSTSDRQSLLPRSADPTEAAALPPAPLRRTASPRPTRTHVEDAEDVSAPDRDGRRSPAPTRSPSPSVRAVAGPSPSTDPLLAVAPLSVAAPVGGSTVALDDYDQRTADVTLSVAVPAGFDAKLLGSALTWSGSYTAGQETQVVGLGSGQSVAATLTAAPRCDTVWTITATLTTATGTRQVATTEVTLSAC